MKHLPLIFSAVIKHRDHRYETCGDYWKNENGWIEFRVSKMKADYEFLILIHELIEWYLISKSGIRISDIDRFDMRFERERANGLHSQEAEPGDDKRSPYREQHRYATKIEKLLAKKLGVD